MVDIRTFPASTRMFINILYKFVKKIPHKHILPAASEQPTTNQAGPRMAEELERENKQAYSL